MYSRPKLLLLLALAGCAGHAVPPDTPAARKYTVIPKDKDTDLKLYTGAGTIQGAEALGRMQKEAGLILWIAGNQFFAMDEVLARFRQQHPGISVGLITLPPGLELEAIQAGGWSYKGVDYPGRPDVYASVSLGHLQTLKKAGLMDQYAVYMHNELQIMVARGNPKQVRGIADLGRAGLRTSMPNPINEGIMQFYARAVLERHGLWEKISAGRECFSCQTTPENWFTAVHHRETPARIKAGESDAGIVWKTEALEALREGAPVEGVALPPADSLREQVAYAVGVLRDSPHREAGALYLKFLASPDGQDAYAAVGFVKATPQELELKPIP
jgi:ABC-type molybdate transport system substrate-binding protein